MMFSLAFAFFVRGSAPTEPPKTRQAFVVAESLLRTGMSMDQVQRILGKPDDVWLPTDPYQFVRHGETVWAYGTSGHHTMPTLAMLEFLDGKLISGPLRDPSLQPPSPDVISEKELRQAMQALYLGYPEVTPWENVSAVHLVRSANVLIRLGQEKALAVLSEFDRVSEFMTDQWLSDLVRVAFIAKSPDAFAPPAFTPTQSGPPPLTSQTPGSSSGPGFDRSVKAFNPMPIVEQVPLPLRGSFPSLPYAFSDFKLRNADKWTLRTKPLVPADDPFEAYQRLVGSTDWPFQQTAKEGEPAWVQEIGAKRATLSAILDMIRTAYVPDPSTFDASPNTFVESDPQPEIDKMNSQFRAVGGHWDAKREMYVRKDGSILPTSGQTLYPQKQYVFVSNPNYRILVNIHRSDARQVAFEFILKAKSDEPLPKSIVSAVDPQTGKTLSSETLEYRIPSWMMDEGSGVRMSTKDARAEMGTATQLSTGAPIQFKIRCAGKDYVSPIYRP